MIGQTVTRVAASMFVEGNFLVRLLLSADGVTNAVVQGGLGVIANVLLI